MNREIVYQFADVGGLLSYIHALSQWIYSRADSEERDRLIEALYTTPVQATSGTMVPLYLVLPAASAEWPIKPGNVDGAQQVGSYPINTTPVSWAGLALLLQLQPTTVLPARDDLIFVIQGVRDDLLGVLDAIFALEDEHSEDVELLLAPVEPGSLGGLKLGADDQDAKSRYVPGWQAKDAPSADADKAVACLVRVSGLRRFYLLEKTLLDPHLRLFYRHIFPPFVPVPPGLEIYVEWGYRYALPPATFLMEAWQREKLGLVLLPAPRAGAGPLVISSALTFRPVLHVARHVALVDASKQAEVVPPATDVKPLDVEVRLRARAAGDVRENEQALRHQIQNDLWRLQRLLAREQEAKLRRLYIYADDASAEITALRNFILENPLAILNEFRYFCGRFEDKTYHLLLLPIEDGSNIVTPDRFPTPPQSERVFRRDPAWAAQDAGYEVFIPRDMELYPTLAAGLEKRSELLLNALSLTDDQSQHKVVIVLWPDKASGALHNYQIPLEGIGAFIPLGGVAMTLNSHVLTARTVEAVRAQVFDSLADAIRPDAIPAELNALRDQIGTTYRTAWDTVRGDLEQIIARGTESAVLGKSILQRYNEVQELEREQLADWDTFLRKVLGLAERIYSQTANREANARAREAALIVSLQKHIEQRLSKPLRASLDNISKSVQGFDAAVDRSDIATRLEDLAKDIRPVEMPAVPADDLLELPASTDESPFAEQAPAPFTTQLAEDQPAESPETP